jgi:hypothetical protein
LTRLALAAVLVTIVVAPAYAEAPTGFAEFPWGTSLDVLREQFLSKRCDSSRESRRGWQTVQCQSYHVEGLLVPILRLDFEPPNALAGYYMVVPRSSYRAFRQLVVQRFGQPTLRSGLPFLGESLSWTWTGARATLIEKCDEDSSCMEVKTTALERKLEQIRERERRDSAQSF